MATVRMKKGNKYADVYDSPEAIKNAQMNGYSIVEEIKNTVEKTDAVEVKSEVEEKPRKARKAKTAE